MKSEAPAYRILVIDDDESLHGVYSLMLAPASELPASYRSAAPTQIPPPAPPTAFPTFDIDFAFQGQEGLGCVRKALAEQRPYTMAFVDVRMPPGWDGIETIERIWKECFDLQVVICTGNADFSWHDLIRRFGHSDRLLVLKKPFEMTEVRQVAYSMAEKWNLARQAQSHLQRLQKLVSERTAKLQEANLSLERKIAERKQAEEELRRERDYIGQIIRESPALIVGIAPDGSTTFVNPAVSRHTGYSAEELIGKNWWRLFYPREEFAQVERLQAELAQGQVRDYEMALTTKSGEKRTVSWNSLNKCNDAGELVEVIGFGNDITERKRAEVARETMEIQLRHAQKLESIGQLAAGIAHEINTPTQYIGDNIRFLQSSFRDVKELHRRFAALLQAAKTSQLTQELLAETEAAVQPANFEYLLQEIPGAIEQSLEGVDRVGRIVRAMKDFSHPGTGEKMPIDLNKAIETALTVAGNEWKYVAKIATDFDANLPLVPCLPGEFNQVVLNLVVNAAHAIADAAESGRRGLGVITASTRLSGEWVEIRIKDTGTGIPEKIRDKIFDPFFTTKPVGKGTGQGLAIAHAVIVEQHQGQLTFETELGAGTEFLIRLPLHPAPSGKAKGRP